jgi:hypothetical protein
MDRVEARRQYLGQCGLPGSRKPHNQNFSCHGFFQRPIQDFRPVVSGGASCVKGDPLG